MVAHELGVGTGISRRAVIQLTGAAVALPLTPSHSNTLENWRMSFTPKFVDLVRNTTTTQGTGNFVLGPMGRILKSKLGALVSRQKAPFFVAKFNKPDMETLRELLESGKIKSVIERVYPFPEIADALQYMGEGHARANLVVTL